MNSRTPIIAAGLGHAVKAALVGAVIAGCGFAPTGVAPDGAGGDGGPGIDGDGGPTLDGPPGVPLCDDGDQDLLLCVSFDDGTPRNDAASSIQPQRMIDVDPIAGQVGMGGGFGDTTVLQFPEDSRLDLLQPFAFELFVRLDEPPGTTGSRRIGLVDNNGQYSLFADQRDLGSGTQIYPYCNAQATVVGTMPLVIGQWHHVACVQEAGMLRIYVDGVVASVANPTPIATMVSNGTVIGQDGDGNPETQSDAMVGGVDELRLWRVARGADQIQAAAARR